MKNQKMNFWQIFNMSFGFLGIQCGYALQNANVSRIFQSLGANLDSLSYFWLAAPITGMIVQPIIGHYSDRTWCRLGRRRPYFLVGAILSSIMLILMPHAGSFTTLRSALMIAVGTFMIMDVSFNVAMEPFRALVADKLPSEQRTKGFAIQTALIGIGAVLGSILPYIITKWFGAANTAPTGSVAPNVSWSFYIGGAMLLFCVLCTIFTTSENPPENKIKEKDDGLVGIFKDLGNIPKTMRQLGIVQFFSWFALFSMWVYMTPAVAEHCYNTVDNESLAYGDAADWVGVLMGIYNGVAAIFAFFLPVIASKISRKGTHALSLVLGALGFASFLVFKNPQLLIISMVGVGIAWASILAMPYSILSGSIPAAKMGTYMGIFNFFITVPQIFNGLLGGIMLKYLYNGHSIYALVFSGVCLLIAAVASMYVDDVDDPIQLRMCRKIKNN